MEWGLSVPQVQSINFDEHPRTNQLRRIIRLVSMNCVVVSPWRRGEWTACSQYTRPPVSAAVQNDIYSPNYTYIKKMRIKGGWERTALQIRTHF